MEVSSTTLEPLGIGEEGLARAVVLLPLIDEKRIRRCNVVKKRPFLRCAAAMIDVAADKGAKDPAMES